jgi:hypothetical protein
MGERQPCFVTKENAREIGTRAAARRWGPRRVVRLDDLNEAGRRLVLALIAAAKTRADKEEPTASELPVGSRGGQRVRADNPAAA